MLLSGEVMVQAVQVLLGAKPRSVGPRDIITAQV